MTEHMTHHSDAQDTVQLLLAAAEEGNLVTVKQLLQHVTDVDRCKDQVSATQSRIIFTNFTLFVHRHQ
jgi:hypothetical protein